MVFQALTFSINGQPLKEIWSYSNYVSKLKCANLFNEYFS